MLELGSASEGGNSSTAHLRGAGTVGCKQLVLQFFMVLCFASKDFEGK